MYSMQYSRIKYIHNHCVRLYIYPCPHEGVCCDAQDELYKKFFSDGREFNIKGWYLLHSMSMYARAWSESKIGFGHQTDDDGFQINR